MMKTFFPFARKANHANRMDTLIDVHGISINVTWKNIRNIHLRVCQPDGHVRVSAPQRMSLNAVHAFVASKLEWVVHQRERINAQIRPPPPQFIDGEEHPLWGQFYPLNIIEKNAAPLATWDARTILLQIRPGMLEVSARGTVLDSMYRAQTKAALPDLMAKWEPKMNVRAKDVQVRKMKSRWGSCNTRTHHIRFSSELAKKPPECLEYVVVHELAHLLEPSHNRRFYTFMDQFMPNWKQCRETLNHFPANRTNGTLSNPP